MNRDIDNEAQGLAAEAAARQTTGRGGANAPVPDVKIDWIRDAGSEALRASGGGIEDADPAAT